MDIAVFRKAFWQAFGATRNDPEYRFGDPLEGIREDLCPDVDGMMSIKKQRLLNLAFANLPSGEAYLEVGTFKGKSLISAMHGNPIRPVIACDNFNEFRDLGNDLGETRKNLARYGLEERVTFWDCDFRSVYTPDRIPHPIGLYFYDGAHDYEAQYDAIALAEPFLADSALVLVDDWRYDVDSGSRAREATLNAIGKSPHAWELMYELPARFNGDRAMWWNGVGVLSFARNG